jgi:uncharacterized NAD(P)/FAD-binding protein YdhS
MEQFDIVFIGGGVAATVSLIEVINKLKTNQGPKKRIAVIEKTEEIWKGVPYGAQSSVNCLIITSVKEFTNPAEQPEFFSWIKANREEWAGQMLDRGGITAKRWLENNLPHIEQEAWDKVFLPRFVFGNYSRQKLTSMLEKVKAEGTADITLIKAEATNISKEPGGYSVTFEYPDHRSELIEATKVVVAVGSPPVKRLCDFTDDRGLYINDIYVPSIDENLKILTERISAPIKRENNHVLIIGSNASSLEILYLLEGMPELRNAIHKTVILSTSGMLPYHISNAHLDAYPIPHLDKLRAEGNYTIETLIAAATEEVKAAVKNGANMNYIGHIVRNTLELLTPLGEDGKKHFYGNYGMKLRDMFRRAGAEYKSASERLIESGEVELLKGRFVAATPCDGGLSVTYRDPATSETKTYPATFSAVINCTGSDNLNECSSRLLNSMVNSDLCSMNISGKGIVVNERFEAAPDLFVMGPLLGGNANNVIHFWQLENVSRLMDLAPLLAKELV